jgi:hypothetical protein
MVNMYGSNMLNSARIHEIWSQLNKTKCFIKSDQYRYFKNVIFWSFSTCILKQ